MAQRLETTLCFSTVDRDRRGSTETNDFTLSLPGRYEALSVSVSGVEAPLPQLLVEAPWSEMAFDIGLSVWESDRFQDVELGDRTVRVALPQPFLSVRHDGEGRWTATEAHGLSAELASELDAHVLWLEDDGSLRRSSVVGVPTESEATTSILPRDGSQGCLVCCGAGVRSFPSPLHLAKALTAAFAVARVVFDYDCATMALSFKCARPCRFSSGGLLSALGFRPTPDKPQSSGASAPFPRDLVRAELPVGNYEPHSLARAAEQRLDAAAVCCSTKLSEFFVHVWGADEPARVRVAPLQAWHPSVLAAHVAAALPAPLRLGYDEASDRFVMETDDAARPFRLFFPEATDLDVRLGFDGAEHGRLATRLEGKRRHFAATAAAVSCATTPRKRFAFRAESRLRGPASAATEGWTVAAGALPPEGLVWGLVDGAAEWCVVEAAGARRWPLRRLGSTQDVAPAVVTAVPRPGGAVNLYFPPRRGLAWSRLAEIFGFAAGANVGGEASAQWCLEPPAYLLLDLQVPQMFGGVLHRFGEDARQFLGKLVCYPALRIDRGYPGQKTAAGPCVVSQVHVRLLNPWLDLYQMHGRNWSGSLLLTTQGGATSTACA